MPSIIQLFIFLCINLSTIFPSYEPLSSDNEDERGKMLIKADQLSHNLISSEKESSQDHNDMSMALKFLCKTAATVTGGIILYELYYLSTTLKDN